MDVKTLIGLPLQIVKHKLNEQSIEYIVTENSDLQKTYDNLLVVNIKQIEHNKFEIVTDKFLLDI